MNSEGCSQHKSAAYLSKKLKAFCQGIDHSLSAIMFFTRAQLGRKASPQLERDLREVMERIDQVQLLVSEMQRSVGNIGSLDSTGALIAATRERFCRARSNDRHS